MSNTLKRVLISIIPIVIGIAMGAYAIATPGDQSELSLDAGGILGVGIAALLFIAKAKWSK